MCITPLTLYQKKVSQYGNSTNIVPCGKCPACKKRKRNGWAFRLYNELQKSSSAAMFTFTYATEPTTENGEPTLVKKDFQDFMKRLRMRQDVKNIVYFASGEYGTKSGRPHYHAIILNLPLYYTKEPAFIENAWQKGNVHIAECNMKTINYTLKYLMKGGYQPKWDEAKQFVLMSKGIGAQWLTPQMKKYLKSNEANYATLPGGTKIALPRYYRDKTFSKHTLAKIGAKAKKAAIEKQEKQFPTELQKVEWTKRQIAQDAKELNNNNDLL